MKPLIRLSLTRSPSPPSLAMLNRGWVGTGGTQAVKGWRRAQYKFDVYFTAIQATALVSAIPGVLFWGISKLTAS
jgi:hypothetical protein